MTTLNYDLIGDIHGHAEVLRRLLHEMEYCDDDGAFRHPDRKVIFVGDFVDRGPKQREVLHLARSMCEQTSMPSGEPRPPKSRHARQMPFLAHPTQFERVTLAFGASPLTLPQSPPARCPRPGNRLNQRPMHP